MSIRMTTRGDAPALATAEYEALLSTLRDLPGSAWEAPTDCEGWTVWHIVAHVVGAAEEAARPAVLVRHTVGALGRHRTGVLVDALNAQQIADRRGRTPRDLVDELARLAPAAVRGRHRLPAAVRRLPLPAAAGCQPGDTLGYLYDVIYTRDIWLHRVDIARATGTPMPPSDAEAAVLEQVVRDLARSWRGPGFTLALSGRVSGLWPIGDARPGAPVITLDAVALCRSLSGRGDEGWPATAGPGASGVLEDLRRARVAF